LFYSDAHALTSSRRSWWCWWPSVWPRARSSSCRSPWTAWPTTCEPPTHTDLRHRRGWLPSSTTWKLAACCSMSVRARSSLEWWTC